MGLKPVLRRSKTTIYTKLEAKDDDVRSTLLLTRENKTPTIAQSLVRKYPETMPFCST